MSQYRDDQEAARHRIASLESKLAERDEDLAARERELSERDQEIARLARELRTAGTTRITPLRRPSGARFVVAGAMSAAVVAGMLGFLNVRRASSPPSVPAVTFAEPPPRVPVVGPPVRTSHAYPFVPNLQSLPRQEAAAAKDEQERFYKLAPEVWSGRASMSEIRAFMAFCQRVGNTACQKEAAEILQWKLETEAK